jgi:hypothetical protein
VDAPSCSAISTRSAETGHWRRSTETALYLATTVIPAERVAPAIRDHCTIENTSHYSRDVTMGEDRSRISGFAFNILTANGRASLAQDSFRAAIAGLAPLLRLLRIPER